MASHDRPEWLAQPDERARTETLQPHGRTLPGRRLTHVVLVAVLLSYLGMTVVNVLRVVPTPTALFASLASLTGIFALQLVHSAQRSGHSSLWRRCLSLTAQALLTYLPITICRAEWGALAGFLAGSLLLLLPPVPGWSLYGVVGLSMLVPPMLDGRPALDSVYLSQFTLLTGLVVYGLARITELIRVLHETQDELTQMAVTTERLRFARDLHDLLGYSLSAITLKSELVHRLIAVNPARATKEVEDVLAIARQSLDDVRSVASGFREMSLSQEVAAARSVLSAAEVVVRVDYHLTELNQAVDTVLAAVLREAVTNLLRHSRARWCGVEAGLEGERVRLSVTNDGADPDYRDPSPHSGTGLENLEMRLRSVGGELTVERTPAGTFQLVAYAPVHRVPRFPALRDQRGSAKGQRLDHPSRLS